MKNGSPNYGGSSAPYRQPTDYSEPSSFTNLPYTSSPNFIPFQNRRGPTYILNKFCKECAAALDEKWKVCPVCETKVSPVIKLDSLKPKKCECGRNVCDDFRFCPQCAKPVDESWKDKPTCKCGTVYAEKAKYCVGCSNGIRCSSHKPLSGTVTRSRKRS
ncbi:MAG: hypothetical protein AAB664_00055 [Patescibacteria group bacterium]